MKTPVIVWDLDYTLCNALDREHLVDESRRNGDWVKYGFKGIDEEPTIYANSFRKLQAGFKTIILTARPSVCGLATEMWLMENGLYPDELYMMNTSVYGCDNKSFKIDVFKKLQETYDIVLYFDDLVSHNKHFSQQLNIPTATVLSDAV